MPNNASWEKLRKVIDLFVPHPAKVETTELYPDWELNLQPPTLPLSDIFQMGLQLKCCLSHLPGVGIASMLSRERVSNTQGRAQKYHPYVLRETASWSKITGSYPSLHMHEEFLKVPNITRTKEASQYSINQKCSCPMDSSLEFMPVSFNCLLDTF